MPKALDFGAKGYVFFRSEEDGDRFVHVSYWDDREDFDRYWFSHEMQAIRRAIQGTHTLPLLPHWHMVLAHHGSVS